MAQHGTEAHWSRNQKVLLPENMDWTAVSNATAQTANGLQKSMVSSAIQQAKAGQVAQVGCAGLEATGGVLLQGHEHRERK